MGEELPFLALLAIAALDPEFFLQPSGDVAPFGGSDHLKNDSESPVFVLSPIPFFCHYYADGN